jgi:septum formation protein
MAKKLILASESPRRKLLLQSLGLGFEIIPSKIDETFDETVPIENTVKELAFKKADYVAKSINCPAIIIGCDTTVVIDGKSLGKPENFDDAFRMLKLLSGKYHTVISGMAVIDNVANKTIIDCVSSEVLFKEMSEEEISNYIKTGEPMDKAGAYAIQGVGSIFVKSISGCYYNIVGLPVFRLAEILKALDLDILAVNLNSMN